MVPGPNIQSATVLSVTLPIYINNKYVGINNKL